LAKSFFSLSEYTIKLRRNFFFTSFLCVSHFQYTPLELRDVFGVTIPGELLKPGLILCLIWFTFNYFYSLYAEYTQWKKSFIEDVDPDVYTTSNFWRKKTLIPEINLLTDNEVEIHATFAGKISNRSEVQLNEIEHLLTNLENSIKEVITSDVKRISR
jgi:hypothetical protein